MYKHVYIWGGGVLVSCPGQVFLLFIVVSNASKAQSLAQIPQNYKIFKDSEVIEVYCVLVSNLVRLWRLLSINSFKL